MRLITNNRLTALIYIYIYIYVNNTLVRKTFTSFEEWRFAHISPPQYQFKCSISQMQHLGTVSAIGKVMKCHCNSIIAIPYVNFLKRIRLILNIKALSSDDPTHSGKAWNGENTHLNVIGSCLRANSIDLSSHACVHHTWVIVHAVL